MYFMNLETGEVLTAAEMRQQAAELYDLGDETNACSWREYYAVVNIEA